MNHPCLNTPVLLSAAAALNITLTGRQTEQFERYAELLCEWNQRVNLTAITDPTGIAILHFADSLSVAANIPPRQGASLIDVGTGAGFPGLALKILRPDLRLLLLDSLNKRVNFLRCVTQELGLQEVFALHARAEDAGRQSEYRERFDYATARAVASLPALCEYCLPFVKKGGLFIAQKGPNPKEEIAAAQKAITILGGKLDGVFEFNLPARRGRGPQRPEEAEEHSFPARSIIAIQKISQTPREYPRNAAKMSKNPL